MLCQVRLGLVRSGRSELVTLVHVSSGYIWLYQVASFYVRLFQVREGYVSFGQVRSC